MRFFLNKRGKKGLLGVFAGSFVAQVPDLMGGVVCAGKGDVHTRLRFFMSGGFSADLPARAARCRPAELTE